jgi:hypothetical protein
MSMVSMAQLEQVLHSDRLLGISILDKIAETRHVKMHTVSEKILRIVGDRAATLAALNDISQKCMTTHFEHWRVSSRKATQQATKTEDSASSPGTEVAGAEVYNFISSAARASIGKRELEVLKSTTGVLTNFKELKGVVRQTTTSNLIEANADRRLSSWVDIAQNKWTTLVERCSPCRI